MLLGSTSAKAVHRVLMKLTPVGSVEFFPMVSLPFVSFIPTFGSSNEELFLSFKGFSVVVESSLEFVSFVLEFLLPFIFASFGLELEFPPSFSVSILLPLLFSVTFCQELIH